MADFTGIPACIAKIYSGILPEIQREWPFVYSGSTWEMKKEIIHVTIRMVTIVLLLFLHYYECNTWRWIEKMKLF